MSELHFHKQLWHIYKCTDDGDLYVRLLTFVSISIQLNVVFTWIIPFKQDCVWRLYRNRGESVPVYGGILVFGCPLGSIFQNRLNAGTSGDLWTPDQGFALDPPWALQSPASFSRFGNFHLCRIHFHRLSVSQSVPFQFYVRSISLSDMFLFLNNLAEVATM